MSQNLYAWKLDGGNDIVYTITPTPTTSDYIYKADGTQYSYDEYDDGQVAYSNIIYATDGSTYIQLLGIDPV